MSSSKILPFNELTEFMTENIQPNLSANLTVAMKDLVEMYLVATSFKPDLAEILYEESEVGHLITMRCFHSLNTTTVAGRLWNMVVVVRTNDDGQITEIVQAYVTLLKGKTT